MTVPRYYMNMRYRGRLFMDDEGDDLTEDCVRDYALQTARDLIANGRMDTIRCWFDCSFEVTDEAGKLVVQLPFSETKSTTR